MRFISLLLYLVALFPLLGNCDTDETTLYPRMPMPITNVFVIANDTQAPPYEWSYAHPDRLVKVLSNDKKTEQKFLDFVYTRSESWPAITSFSTSDSPTHDDDEDIQCLWLNFNLDPSLDPDSDEAGSTGMGEGSYLCYTTQEDGLAVSEKKAEVIFLEISSSEKTKEPSFVGDYEKLKLNDPDEDNELGEVWLYYQLRKPSDLIYRRSSATVQEALDESSFLETSASISSSSSSSSLSPSFAQAFNSDNSLTLDGFKDKDNQALSALQAALNTKTFATSDQSTELLQTDADQNNENKNNKNTIKSSSDEYYDQELAQLPRPMKGHTVGTFSLFGAFNKLRSYRFATISPLGITTYSYSEVWDMRTTWDTYHAMLVFGGMTTENADGSSTTSPQYTNDLYTLFPKHMPTRDNDARTRIDKFDQDTLVWTKLQTTGSPPSARAGHTMTHIRRSDSSAWSHVGGTWQQLPDHASYGIAGSLFPFGRHYPSMDVHLVIGGYDGETFHSSVHMLATDRFVGLDGAASTEFKPNFKWTQVKPEIVVDDEAEETLESQSAGEPEFYARHKHTATLYHPERIVVIGGFGIPAQEEGIISKKAGQKRVGFIDQVAILEFKLYGQGDETSIKSWWHFPTAIIDEDEGFLDGPGAIFGHSAVAMQVEVGSEGKKEIAVAVFGGFGFGGPAGDWVWMLRISDDMKELKWTKAEVLPTQNGGVGRIGASVLGSAHDTIISMCSMVECIGSSVRCERPEPECTGKTDEWGWECWMWYPDGDSSATPAVDIDQSEFQIEAVCLNEGSEFEPTSAPITYSLLGSADNEQIHDDDAAMTAADKEWPSDTELQTVYLYGGHNGDELLTPMHADQLRCTSIKQCEVRAVKYPLQNAAVLLETQADVSDTSASSTSTTSSSQAYGYEREQNTRSELGIIKFGGDRMDQTLYILGGREQSNSYTWRTDADRWRMFPEVFHLNTENRLENNPESDQLPSES